MRPAPRLDATARMYATGKNAIFGIIIAMGIRPVSLANCYEGQYYRQIAQRKGDASPFLHGLGDSETIGAAKRTATKSPHTA
jgi:hypothetical protein